MASNPIRFSNYTNASFGSDGNSKNADKREKEKDLWTSMLHSVASAKRLPEKNLLVLGGSVDSQREFLEALSVSDARGRAASHPSKIPSVANQFALGYTYYDVLDADQEDSLARVSLYTLSTPTLTFGALLRPLLTPQTVPNTLIVVLLDWTVPWRWMRQLREWILLLRTVILSLSDETKETMEEVMMSWRHRGRGGSVNLDGTTAVAAAEGDVSMPLGPGEWEDALGIPLCLVCQNAGNMEYLEKTHSWKEEEFDIVLQFLRTVLLRHGASLIYTTPSSPSQLPTLVHACLGIHSLLKKEPLRHNVIDRDKILVPPNWDSWGKIRVLGEGFNVEQVNDGWLIDLEQADFPRPEPQVTGAVVTGAKDVREDVAIAQTPQAADAETKDPQGSAVVLYEKSVQDPTLDALIRGAAGGGLGQAGKLEVETQDTQSFLEDQYRLLEKMRQQQDQEIREEIRENPFVQMAAEAAGERLPLMNGGVNAMKDGEPSVFVTGARVNEHIGPVQINMGGIQVDADDMAQRLKDRQALGNTTDDAVDAQADPQAPPMDTGHLEAFFTNLMNRSSKA